MIFQNVEIKSNLISKIILIFFSADSKILSVSLKKKKIFLRFCLCIFEGDTVKSDCPVQIFSKMMKYLMI